MLDGVHVPLARDFERRFPGPQEVALYPLFGAMLVTPLDCVVNIVRRFPIADGGNLIVTRFIDIDERCGRGDRIHHSQRQRKDGNAVDDGAPRSPATRDG